MPLIIASVIFLSNWVHVSSTPSLMAALSMCVRVSVHHIFNKPMCFSDDLSCVTIGRPKSECPVSMLTLPPKLRVNATPLARVRSMVSF